MILIVYPHLVYRFASSQTVLVTYRRQAYGGFRDLGLDEVERVDVLIRYT